MAALLDKEGVRIVCDGDTSLGLEGRKREEGMMKGDGREPQGNTASIR